MRVYTEQKAKQLTEAVCNCCGKKLLVENGILKEECVHITHDFGFFGKKDGTSHTFDLCEGCRICDSRGNKRAGRAVVISGIPGFPIIP